jgi:predicted dienelactone hydrolase
MKGLSFLLALVLSAGSRVALAADAERVVGTVTIEMESKATSRKISSELWFQAATGARVEPFAARPPLRPILIARDATPSLSSGKRPLIVMSHGNFGSRFSLGWLAVQFVKSGYVVLSASHPGTMAGDQSAAGRYRLWDRSRDISFAIDEVLNNPRWNTLIDESRIGFVGHSFGGWIGVSLAGGRYDPARQRAFCERAQKRDLYCAGTLKDNIAGVPTNDAGDSFRDDRIKAFYIMGSGPGQGFIRESLESISAPFRVDTAQFDDVLEPQANSSTLARHTRGAREVMRPAGHFVYAPECIGPVPAEARQICNDPAGVDRALVHEQVARDAVDFFNSTLSGK